MNSSKIIKGFTLIELLIVVAIIAILAAIAVPNFLEAQTRAKISRAMADMRTIDVGLKTYEIDNNTVPLMNYVNFAIPPESEAGEAPYLRTLERLTSPIAYLTGRGTFQDPFPAKATRRLGEPDEDPIGNDPERRLGLSEYFYSTRGKKSGSDQAEHLQWGDSGAKVQWYLLQSSGPQLLKWYYGKEVNGALGNDTPFTRALAMNILYDASNGTVSPGTILRAGGQPTGRGSVLGKMVMQANP